jgi:beta-D-xylosidase 4
MPDCELDWVQLRPNLGRLKTVVSELCIDYGSEDDTEILPRFACALPATQHLPFCNRSLTAEARAADLTPRLTVQEKASGVLAMLMTHTSYLNGTEVNYNLRQTAGIPRLGIPPMKYNEAMHGIVALCLHNGSCPTSFPMQITQTASFNRSLWRAVATALGTEGRALYNAGLDAANYWAPDVNPFRDPRYGRGQETGGEDAWVNGQVASEYFQGLQGGSAESDVLLSTATCKHVPVYDVQTPKDTGNISVRDMHDYYLLPWRACSGVNDDARVGVQKAETG